MNRLKAAWYALTGTLEHIPSNVRMIDDSENELHLRLGITEDRSEQLRDYMARAITVTEDPAEAMSIVSNQCTHPNELALVCYALGYYMGDALAHVNREEEE